MIHTELSFGAVVKAGILVATLLLMAAPSSSFAEGPPLPALPGSSGLPDLELSGLRKLPRLPTPAGLPSRALPAPAVVSESRNRGHDKRAKRDRRDYEQQHDQYSFSDERGREREWHEHRNHGRHDQWRSENDD